MPLHPSLGPDGRPTPSTLFLTVHHALRRDAHRFPAAVRVGVEPAAIAAHWARYRAILVRHHEHEDELLFPAVLAAHPHLATVVEELAADHADLDDVLAGLDSAYADLAAATGRVRVEVAVGWADRLAAVLDRHLDREEEHLVPVMERGELGGPAPEAGPQGDLDAPAFQLPWLTDGLDPRVAEVLLGLLPPPLQEAFPAWRAAYGAGPLAVASGAVA